METCEFQMRFSSFLADVLAALTAAAVIAIAAWIYSWLRNLNLEKGLQKALSPNGVGVYYSQEPLEAHLLFKYITIPTHIFVYVQFC